ncbi:MAG: FGGY-family carbohydrate kinase [Oscillatoriales cyanobacterium SM2_2_1]|nr:FGGY-family carbohydrate kinase [Oscillatoriales cyanobacterium SM2_2_1]
MTVTLGIDFGTSGVRAIALDGTGQVLAQSRAPYQIEVIATWQPALWHVLSQISPGICAQVEAIALDATSATVLLTDQHGHPFGKPLLYRDACPPELTTHLTAIAPPGHIAATATSSFSKYLQLSQAGVQGDFWHQADWLGFLLHGQRGISDWHNTLKLGFDPETLAYGDWVAQNTALHLPATVLPPGAAIAPLQPKVREQFGFAPDCWVCAGTTDSTAAFLAATGTPTIGTAVTSLGSTMVLKILGDRRLDDSRYGLYSHRLDLEGQTHWLIGGGSNTGGIILHHLFGDRLPTLTAQIDPTVPCPELYCNYYPLASPGERFPICDPQKATQLTPRPAQDELFLYGILTSLARIERRGYDLLQNLGAPVPHSLFTVGGGAQNFIWTYLRAQLMPFLRSPIHPEAAYGAALLARSFHK